MTPREQMQPAPPPCPQYDDDEISLLDLLLVLVRRKKLIFFTTLFFALGAIAFSMLRTPAAPPAPVVQEEKQEELPPPLYTASVRFLPPVAKSLVLSGMDMISGNPSAPSQIVWLSALKGPEVRDILMDGFGPEGWRSLLAAEKEAELREIMEASDETTRLDAEGPASEDVAADEAPEAEKDSNENDEAPESPGVVERAIGKMTLLPEQNGTFVLSVEHADRLRVAAIAGAYVEALEKFLSERLLLETSAARLQIESELEHTRTRLAEAEKALNDYRSSKGWTLPSLLRADPENASSNEDAPADFVYASLLREWRFREALYNTLLWNHEAARMNEAHGRVEIPVLETALTPEPGASALSQEPAAPPAPPAPPKSRRSLVVVLGAFLGFFLSIFMAFMAEFWKKASEDPEQSEKVRELRESLGITRLFSREKKPPKKR